VAQVVSSTGRFTDVIERTDQLRALIPAPQPDAPAVRKQRPRLDAHCRAVIAQAPFLLLATAGSDGRCDVSPRGDAPGFVQVLDDETLAIPDRPGNRRLDSLQNILDNPHAGLIFLVPGMDETLRVNGRAMLVRDPDLLAQMPARGKTPTLAIVIETEEVYFQCARAFKRSRLWQPDTWLDRDTLPTLGRILKDQARIDDLTVEQIDCYLDEANRNLY
jgi:PPOX class probable FMN-dependent enzyme